MARFTMQFLTSALLLAAAASASPHQLRPRQECPKPAPQVDLGYEIYEGKYNGSTQLNEYLGYENQPSFPIRSLSSSHKLTRSVGFVMLRPQRGPTAGKLPSRLPPIAVKSCRRRLCLQDVPRRTMRRCEFYTFHSFRRFILILKSPSVHQATVSRAMKTASSSACTRRPTRPICPCWFGSVCVMEAFTPRTGHANVVQMVEDMAPARETRISLPS